jgi:hypothetical protein
MQRTSTSCASSMRVRLLSRLREIENSEKRFFIGDPNTAPLYSTYFGFLFYVLLRPLMESLHRLFMLDRLFRSHRQPIPLATLLESLECSVSTFKRFVSILREQYGHPIIYSKQHNGYCYVILLPFCRHTKEKQRL